MCEIKREQQQQIKQISDFSKKFFLDTEKHFLALETQFLPSPTAQADLAQKQLREVICECRKEFSLHQEK